MSKDLTAASATPLVLGILRRGDCYGYAIIRDIGEVSSGALAWTEGMLYPVLHRLEEQGAVESYWEGPAGGRRRRYYRITRQGRKHLDELVEQWRTVDAALSGILDGEGICRGGGFPKKRLA